MLELNPQLRFLNRAGQRGSEQEGFTLVELLVVVLIIGILAAIAIPSLASQPTKAKDASAKELAHTAQIAAETVAINNSGSYTTIAGPASLSAVEPTIPTSGSSAYLSAAIGSATGYAVTVTAASGNTYTITRTAAGVFQRTCSVPTGGNPGGCAAGIW